ncbi:unnamed protein product [Paramecium sonneborni]|uniref:Ubiquitin-like domain-containing protein n=1 Tax=Paramecium sonneborni TaxID=65129 RepID=A0A8S1K064_9CILI|nr:unnamed protein product [Paramecium sonneborni]
MINIKLQIPNAINKIYEIRFNQNKKISELIEWIYDNFNEFFNLKDKNKLNLHNKTNGQNYDNIDKQLGSCLKQNDLLSISEQEIQVNPIIPDQTKMLSLFLKNQNDNLEIKIAFDTTLQELMNYLKDRYSISNHYNLQLFYEQKNLSNLNKQMTLSELNIKDGGLIYFEFTLPQVKGQIKIFLRCNGACHQLVFDRNETLITVSSIALQQFGYEINAVAFELLIKGESYNSEDKRKLTLAQIQLQDGDSIELKLRFLGGNNKI